MTKNPPTLVGDAIRRRGRRGAKSAPTTSPTDQLQNLAVDAAKATATAVQETPNTITAALDDVRDFYLDGRKFVNRCTKPDWKVFKRNFWVVAGGVGLMGAIGFVVKLIHILVNKWLLEDRLGL